MKPAPPLDDGRAGFKPAPPLDDGRAGFKPAPPLDDGRAGFKPAPPLDDGRAGFKPAPPLDDGRAGFKPAPAVLYCGHDSAAKHKRTPLLDYSPRSRYRARRRAIASRRRRLFMLLAIATIIGCGALGLWLWPRTAQAPTMVQRAAPTDAATRLHPVSAGSNPAPAAPAATQAAWQQGGTATFFHSQRLTYEPDFYVPQVQAFLDSQPGRLKQFNAPIGNRREQLAEIVIGQCLYYSVNPKIVLALLESQGALLSTAQPTAAQLDWALGYHTKDKKPNEDKLKGLTAQMRWAVRQMLYARRDFTSAPLLTFADATTVQAPAQWEIGQYVLARALAPTTTPEKLAARMQAFSETYARLFGDPRSAPTDWPAPAAPFLAWPMQHPARITSFFDHDGPFLSRNGGTFSYWGRNETDLSYDGHDGWDYAIAPPDPALAAADGTVVFASNADDNCATTAVVLDHGNGYRSLYWHLSEIRVALGQKVAAGEPVGISGASGCALGPHLHFGVQYLGRNTDPYGYCGSVADPWANNPAGTISTWLWQDRLSPCAPAPAGVIVVDTDSAGFSKTGDWQAVPIGFGGGALFTRSVGPLVQPTVAATPLATAGSTPVATAPVATVVPSATARYRATITNAGRYRVMAYVPYAINGLDEATSVAYQVQHASGEATLTIDLQQVANEWIDLGTYEFATGETEVRLDNRASAADQSIWADAVIWQPVQ